MFEYDAMIAITSLTLLEVILGIDNILFINLMVAKVSSKQREFVRRLGICLALFTRLGLLFTIGWILTLNQTLFSYYGMDFSIRTSVFILGGFFLLYKAIREIHDHVEGYTAKTSIQAKPKLGLILIQIVLIDLVFSFDSIFTAIGMVAHLSWMATAIILAVCIMLFIAKPIAEFIEKNPSVKLLALAFLVMIGILLVADGFGHHFDRNYVYCAMFFAITIECLNMRHRRHMLNTQ
ncbi:MAG: TerC family protein [Gammaproteobacteria bacterium]|nr:TerC family protein [Gammaproteobacteria bacterium]